VNNTGHDPEDIATHFCNPGPQAALSVSPVNEGPRGCSELLSDLARIQSPYLTQECKAQLEYEF
jgi:hypothetical protein